MQLIIPSEIQEAHMKVRPWLMHIEGENCACLKKDAPEEIKKLWKKILDWDNKNSIRF